MILSLFKRIATAAFFLGITCVSSVAVAASSSRFFLYEADTEVVDYENIDLDQEAIEIALVIASEFDQEEYMSYAGDFYNDGGHSRPYATVVLATPLPTALPKGTLVEGLNSEGKTVHGETYFDYFEGTTELRVRYTSSGALYGSTSCHVGALPSIGIELENTQGCFAETGQLNISSNVIDYSYDVYEDNQNGLTIAGFSTKASEEMLECARCPHEDFWYFYKYYGVHDYANEFVSAAVYGAATRLLSGNADFGSMSLVGRAEAVKKGTVLLNVFMYVIYLLEIALDFCVEDSTSGSVQSWDSAVALYSGSMAEEKKVNTTGGGNMLYRLANRRCSNMNTCGIDGSSSEGIAKVNYDIFNYLVDGQNFLREGECDSARQVKEDVVKLMYVPLLQSILRYAYILGEQSGDEKTRAEAATFAAAILPRIHSCDEASAAIVYDSLRTGAAFTSFSAVKSALEFTYECVGVSCDDVGGFWDDVSGDYFPNAAPCGIPDEVDSDEIKVDEACDVPQKFLDRYGTIINNANRKFQIKTAVKCTGRRDFTKCESKFKTQCMKRVQLAKEKVTQRIMIKAKCSLESAALKLDEIFNDVC